LQIDIAYKLEGAKNAEGLAIIVDIFRSSSMQGFLLENRATIVLSKSANNAVLRGNQDEKSYVMCDDIRESDRVLPNSIYRIRKRGYNLSGLVIHHFSENGVVAMLEAEKVADSVISACFLNYKSVMQHISMNKPCKITIVATGEFGEVSADDYYFAEMLRNCLLGKEVKPEEYINKIKTEVFVPESTKSGICGKTLPELLNAYHGPIGLEDMKLILDPDASYERVPVLDLSRIK
jgi:2-phosphosulfolactate phosphatase